MPSEVGVCGNLCFFKTCVSLFGAVIFGLSFLVRLCFFKSKEQVAEQTRVGMN